MDIFILVHGEMVFQFQKTMESRFPLLMIQMAYQVATLCIYSEQTMVICILGLPVKAFLEINSISDVWKSAQY